jgi:hypothetical protein
MYEEQKTSQVVDILLKLKQVKDDTERDMKEIISELEARGLKILEEKNIKSVSFKGNNGSVIVGMAQTLNMLSIERLNKVFRDNIVDHKVTEKTEIKYSIESDFKKALISCVLKDYETQMTLDELIKKEYGQLNEGQQLVLAKKLKGEYEKDKKTIENILGKNEIEPINIEEELFYIYKIKNYERMIKYFDVEKLEDQVKKLSSSIEVKEVVKVTLKG